MDALRTGFGPKSSQMLIMLAGANAGVKQSASGEVGSAPRPGFRPADGFPHASRKRPGSYPDPGQTECGDPPVQRRRGCGSLRV